MKQIWISQQDRIRVHDEVDKVIEEYAASQGKSKVDIVQEVLKKEKTRWTMPNDSKKANYLLMKYFDNKEETK